MGRHRRRATYLVPGGVITLTVGDAHYCPSHSQASWLLAVGTIEHNECDDEKVALGRGAGGSGSDGLNVAGEITPTQ